jgi:hypothetical protein
LRCFKSYLFFPNTYISLYCLHNQGNGHRLLDSIFLPSLHTSSVIIVVMVNWSFLFFLCNSSCSILCSLQVLIRVNICCLFRLLIMSYEISASDDYALLICSSLENTCMFCCTATVSNLLALFSICLCGYYKLIFKVLHIFWTYVSFFFQLSCFFGRYSYDCRTHALAISSIGFRFYMSSKFWFSNN